MKNKLNEISGWEKMDTWNRIITVGLFILLAVQTIALAWLNLTQLKYHMGYDASSYYLKAYEMWKEKSLICPNWVDQTTLYWDSAVPLAALFMGIFHNIFTAYGMANFVIDVLIIALMFGIMRNMELSVTAQLFAVDLILCPHIGITINNVNDVSYFFSTLSSGSWYGGKVALTLLFVYAWLLLYFDKIQKKYFILYGLVCALYLISGVSSGYYLGVTVLVPAILCGAVSMFVKNDWKELISKQMIFSYVNLAIIFAGKFLATHVLDFTSKDSDMVWTSLQKFWENLGSIFLGYFGLLQGLPFWEGVNILDKDGLKYTLGLGIAAIILVGFVLFIVLLVRKFHVYENKLICVSVVGFNLLMFTVVYTTYAAAYFEERYLIIPLYFMVLGMVSWLDSLDNKLIFKQLGCLALFFLLLLQTYRSDHTYLVTKKDTARMDEVADIVSEIKSPVVYWWGEDYELVFRDMRIYDTDKIYKLFNMDENGNKTNVHWGDYTYYDYASEWDGAVILCTDENNFGQLPEEIRQHFELYQTASWVNVYVSSMNVLGI